MLPLFGPITKGPGILPVEFTVGAIRANGVDKVIVQMSTPAGVQWYFLDPEQARLLGEFATRAAAEAGSGIVVAGPGDVPV